MQHGKRGSSSVLSLAPTILKQAVTRMLAIPSPPAESAPRVTHETAVDFLRLIHARPGGTGALLNLILASKVRGAADLNALSDLVDDAETKLELAHHGRDEAEHAVGVLRRMSELAFTPFRLPPALDRADGLLAGCRARDVKRVYTERGRVGDAELMELAVALSILEEDAVAKLRANHDALAADPETQALIAGVLRDDERHLAALLRRLERLGERFSPRAVEAARERLEELFRQLTFVYYGALQDYFDRATA